MVGPVLYEVTVPYFRKAVENQIKLLQKGKEWCKEHGHEETKLSNGHLVEDMFPLPFHVTFTSYNVVQFLVDVGATDAEAEEIQPEGLSLDELIERAERTLKVLDNVDPAKLAGKEEEPIKIDLGNFSVTKSALDYAHHISGPSFDLWLLQSGKYKDTKLSVVFNMGTLQCAVHCTGLALALATDGGSVSSKPLSSSPPDTDTDTDTDADNDQVNYSHQLQYLEETLAELGFSVKGYLEDAAKNRRQNDPTAIKELASSCRSTCTRVLGIVQTGRGRKRIATSLDTWKTSRPSVGNSRQNFELRKLAERLQELQITCARQVARVSSNHLVTYKHQIRQLQLENRRLQCHNSDRLRTLSGLLRELETKTRTLQQDSSAQTLSSDEIQHIRIQLERMRNQQQPVKKDHALLKSLAFRSSVARHDTIPEAHKRTFSWVFSAPDLAEPSPSASTPSFSLSTWLEQGNGIFWVSGKPGAGKSTLMKFIADHERTQEALAKWSAPKRTAIVSHYFWCAGTQMQRSQSGLLQTLLFEILRQLPDEIESLFPERWSSSNSTGWAMADLYQALYDIVARPGLPVKFCFFIDGLDEFEGDHLTLCHELMTLAKSENVKLCLSSRPWSVFEDAFGSGKMGQLCLHDVTKDDIVSFVQDRFHQNSTTADALNQEQLQELGVAISQRSQGVFLWVSLATKCLLETLSSSDVSENLLQVLESYPPELDDFFTYNLENVPRADQNKMATSFLITEAAEKPLDIGIYYFHDMELADPDYVLSLSPDPPSRLEYRRQLANTTQQLNVICRGLLDVDQKTGVVNCLHRTVRDYLDQAETKTYLIAQAPSGFSPSLCLLRASAAWTKTSRATMSEEPKSEFLSSINSLLASAVQLTTPDDVALCTRLLDDVDNCLVAKGAGAEESLQLLRSQVIGHNLWQYLSDIQSRQPRYFAHLEVPALVVALFPDYEVGEVRERRPRWDNATTQTVSCLLNQGQDPNKFFSTAETLGTRTEKTPWIILCEHILPQHDDEHTANVRRLQGQLRMAMETGILSSFLSQGASPNARCQRPGKAVSVVSTDYLLHSFRLDTDHDQALKAQYLEHIHWFAPKDAEHLKAVTDDFSRLVGKTKGSGESDFLQQVSGRLLEFSSQLQHRRK